MRHWSMSVPITTIVITVLLFQPSRSSIITENNTPLELRDWKKFNFEIADNVLFQY